jgi:hypothetical protein
MDQNTSDVLPCGSFSVNFARVVYDLYRDVARSWRLRVLIPHRVVEREIGDANRPKRASVACANTERHGMKNDRVLHGDTSLTLRAFAKALKERVCCKDIMYKPTYFIRVRVFIKYPTIASSDERLHQYSRVH